MYYGICIVAMLIIIQNCLTVLGASALIVIAGIYNIYNYHDAPYCIKGITHYGAGQSPTNRNKPKSPHLLDKGKSSPNLNGKKRKLPKPDIFDLKPRAGHMIKKDLSHLPPDLRHIFKDAIEVPVLHYDKDQESYADSRVRQLSPFLTKKKRF